MITETISTFFGSVITPAVLIITAIFLIPYVRMIKIMSPKNFISSLKASGKGGSPLRALTLALAGTLGVGNITGVTSALISGGPGAIFWMWMGALIVLGIKYAEVFLAVKYRCRDVKGWYGGAMYYIRDGLGKNKLTRNRSEFFGEILGILCIINSLITGNIVQSNSAVCVVSEEGRLKTGIIIGVLVLLSILFGTRRIEKITSVLIPPLAALYIIISFNIIITNISYIPRVFGDIITSAFTFRSVSGGIIGFSVREAVRFGVMRGIFSNEAGCGTSPTAHASADNNNPHSQGCYGIVEVIFDTIILCTLTAVVMLIADYKYDLIPWLTDSDAAAVTLDAIKALGGELCCSLIKFSIVLFAYATIIAQIYYGTIAIGYITDKKAPRMVYYFLSVFCAVIGSVISSRVMWLSTDIILGIMTALNCVVIILLRRDLS